MVKFLFIGAGPCWRPAGFLGPDDLFERCPQRHGA
jgi:hypothetical protein